MGDIISERYAEALFEIGLELNKRDEFYKGLNHIRDILNSEEKLQLLLNHPRINKEEKKKIVEEIFKKKVKNQLLNFVFILIDNRRINSILDIGDEYEKLLYEHENIERVLAISPVEMDKKSKKNLQDILAKKLGKKIQLENQIDPKILGGLILKYGNKYIDGSVRGELESIKKAIMRWENEVEV